MLFNFSDSKSIQSTKSKDNPYNRFYNHSERSKGRMRVSKNVRFSNDSPSKRLRQYSEGLAHTRPIIKK